jgi:hypothetical protein
MTSAEEAAAANAAYRAANNLPADAQNAAILASQQGQAYLAQQQQIAAQQDAANEAAKHAAAFSQPRNDLGNQPSAAYEAIIAQYNAQKQYSVGSGGRTYQPTGGPQPFRFEDPVNAAQIAYNVALGGGNIGKELISKSQEAGFDPTPYVNRPVQAEVATRQDIAQYDRYGNPLNSMAAYEASMRTAMNPYGRAGFTTPDTLGDLSTQRVARAVEQFRQPLAIAGIPMASENAMRGNILSAQLNKAIGTPGTRDDQFFNVELQKWGQNFVEKSSAYHHTAMDAGQPVPANPFEYRGDLAVEFLKGIQNPEKSSEWFSPVSGEMTPNLPGGKGLQTVAWETAILGTPGVSFDKAVQYLNSKEGQYGPYGALWGGPEYKETGHNAPQFSGVGVVPGTYEQSLIARGVPVTQLGNLIPGSSGSGGSGGGSAAETIAIGEGGGLPARLRSTSQPQSDNAVTTPSYFQDIRNGIANLSGVEGVKLEWIDRVIPQLGAAKQAIGIAESALKVPYNVGASIPSPVATDISSKLSTFSTLDTAKTGGIPIQVLGNIYKGGSAFEAFADYEKISVATEQRASPLISAYETDLAKYNTEIEKYSSAKTAYETKLSAYNTALGEYNQNKTPDGYNKLKSMQTDLEASKPDIAYAKISAMKTNLELQKSAIDSTLLPAELAKSNYTKSASALTGNVDQKTLLTYGVGKVIGDIGAGYKTMVENPARSFVAPGGAVGEFISGVASVPTQISVIVQSALVGGETIIRSPGNLPGLATSGLAMQMKGTYELGTTRPAELLGTIVGMAIIGEGVRGTYGRVRGLATTRGMDYVPVESVGYDVNQGFAIGRPTERGLVESFSRGTLEPAPIRMSLTNQPPEYTPGAGGRPGARLPNAQPGDITLWTAHEYQTLSRGVNVGEAYRVATPGSSEVSGVYGASTLMSYFAKVGRQIPKLIGIDSLFKSPTVYSTTVDAVEAVSRRSSMEAMARPHDYTRMNAEIQAAAAERPTAAFLPLAKAEYEAVIPQNAVIEVTGRNYYTKLGGIGESHFLGTRVPIVEQRVIGFEPQGIVPSVISRGTSSEMRVQPLVSQYGLSFGITSASPIPSPSDSYKVDMASRYDGNSEKPSIAKEAYLNGGSGASERGASSRSPPASPSYSRSSSKSPTESIVRSSIASELSSPLSRVSSPRYYQEYLPSSLITPSRISKYTPTVSTPMPTYVSEPVGYTPPQSPSRPTPVPTPPIVTETPPPPIPFRGSLPFGGGGGGGFRTRKRRKVELFSFEMGEDTPIPLRYGLGGKVTEYVPGTRGIAADILHPGDIAPNRLFDIASRKRNSGDHL